MLSANGTSKMPQSAMNTVPFLCLVFWSCIVQAGHSRSNPHGPTAHNGASTKWAQAVLSLAKSGFLNFLSIFHKRF